MQSTLSIQAAALAEKDAALGRASERYRREAEENREREARLGERVETLERLQEAARHTVLDREERLRQANAALLSASRARERGEPIGVGPIKSSIGKEAVAEEPTRCSQGAVNGALKHHHPPPANGGQTASPEKDLEEYFGAQEWWLHFAGAEKRREEDQTYQRRDDVKTAVVASQSDSRGGEEDDNEAWRLRKLLDRKRLEVVALRQRVLKLEIAARGQAREEKERFAEDKRRMAAAECKLRTQMLAENSRVVTLERLIVVLRTQGGVHDALVSTRNELSVAKVALIQAEGNSKLHELLLVRLLN